MIGRQFGRLTVEAYAGKSPYAHKMWACRCSCGATKTLREAHLTTGAVQSCGCWRREVAKSSNTQHGMTDRPEYRIWQTMRRRCSCPRNPKYPNYGGRGIKVCERWQSFENFYADVGPRPSRAYSLDRIDNNGNYEPGNCRWATSREQANNTRQNRHIVAFGEQRTLAQWARRSGIDAEVIRKRLSRGWDTEKAITAPTRQTALPAGSGVSSDRRRRGGH